MLELINLMTNNRLEIMAASYMKKNNITLTGRDVQYDMKNNLDKQFVVAGVAELNDYYNYGFDDIEQNYFNITLTPKNGSYSERWNLYLHRESFKDLYNDLKNGKVEVIATCKIPKWRYEDNQGNMAMVESASWL